MAKKKENETKKPKKAKVHYDFNPFIKNEIKTKILEHLNEIRDICKDYDKIDEMSDELWQKSFDIVHEIYECDKEKYLSKYNMLTMLRKRLKYTITEKVREMERRRHIHNWIVILDGNLELNDEEAIIYNCYLIFQHLDIMLKETSKHEKKDDKKHQEK